MIELLLNAENALALGLLDSAEQTYRSVLDADPRNGIAAVGLSRVALERGDDAGALALAQAALEIDPENATARRMIDRLEEVARFRDAAPATGATVSAPTPAAPPPAVPAVASEAMIRASAVAQSDPGGLPGPLPATDLTDPAVPEHADDEADDPGGLQTAAAAPPRTLPAASAHKSSTDGQRPDPPNRAPPTDPDDESSPPAAAPATPPTPPTPPAPPARPGLLRRFFRRS